MKHLSKHIVVSTLLVISIVATSFVNRQNVKKNDAAVEATVVEKQKEAPNVVKSKSVFEVADSICQEAGVPFELVKEIGNNESGWRYITNTNGGTDHGDLQVIDATFWHWYKKLDLEGGKTRKNYLKVGIYYLKNLHNKYGSWEKTRFAYGRGRWRGPETWTALEKKFMGKIDFTKYDN
jgi:hypothetical protein